MPPSSPTPRSPTSVFSQCNSELDTVREDVDRRFRDQDRRIDKLAAMSGAYAGMAMNTAGLAGANRIGVGVGGQNGESALAVGYQRAIGNRASIPIGAAFGGRESSAVGGGRFSWVRGGSCARNGLGWGRGGEGRVREG